MPLSPWQRIDNVCEGKMARWAVKATKAVPRTSQAHLEGLQRGNVRLVCCALVPLERKMLTPNFINAKKKGDATMECLAGFDVTHDWATFMANEVDYYQNLTENLTYIAQYEGIQHNINGRAYSFEVARSAAHLTAILKDTSKIAMVLTVEGGHSLAHSLELNDVSGTDAFRTTVLNNTLQLKNATLPIYSLNINHFFWNGLCGHARTLSGAQTVLMPQKEGVNLGFTALGKEVVALLLDDKKGRRILIDLKHTSLLGRKWYYNYIKKRRAVGDNIPIICSHTGISGVSWNSLQYNQRDGAKKNKQSYLNTWTINLSDEDVQHIHDSGGLIGIMLDKYKLVGSLGVATYRKAIVGSNERRQAYVKAIWANFFAAVSAVNRRSAWDILCFGSDFDGMITPYETYAKASDTPDLANDLLQFLQSPTDIDTLFTHKELKRLMFGLSPNEIMKKIMQTNQYECLQRSF